MANENIKDFTNEVMNNETEVVPEQNNEEQHEERRKKAGLVEKFMSLPLWQRIAIVAILGGGVYVGGRTIYKLVSKKPEAVAQAIDLVSENPEVVADVVEAAETAAI